MSIYNIHFYGEIKQNYLLIPLICSAARHRKQGSFSLTLGWNFKLMIRPLLTSLLVGQTHNSITQQYLYPRKT